MPELPEVETVKNGIAGFIGTAKITDVKIYNRHLREIVPADMETKIKGFNIKNYRRIGKYIIIDTDGGVAIVWHLGMSGKIKTCPQLPCELEKHDHIVIKTDGGCLIYNDPRRFGLFTYVDEADLYKSRFLVEMGPDPFDEAFNGEYLQTRLKGKKIPVKTALLDQNIVAGIGNIYASEILYASQVSPLRPANTVSLEECCSLVKNTRTILQKAIANGGSTLRDYHKPDGSLGYFQNLHCVYNKTGQACPNCRCNLAQSGGIKKIVQSGRSTFYCPTIQK